MKIDIYVQRDFSALIVPSGCDLSKLPEEVRTMVNHTLEVDVKQGRDTVEHIIALDVEKAQKEIEKFGYYINQATIKIKER